MSTAPDPKAPSRPANRLATQTSPYLLQHAHNPVDWWPWGQEAIAEARRRDVPILLSVGYSTCYWCHVMERECFEDEAIGRQMSDSFLCVKLDREERPDLDEIYMTALQMMTGRGGWPMNVFLDPASLRPFFAGTYFPPRPARGMPAWPQMLGRIAEAWATQREGVLKQAEEVARAVTEHLSPAREPVAVGEAQVTDALSQVLRSFDRTNGGFGGAPKFPQPVFLEFLLDVRALAADDSTGDAVDEAVRRTLSKMACGGIHDQVGGGFHRYSVDEVWLVPHFEKMLYDNALLAFTYARGARHYGDGEFARVARRTINYVLREMRHEGGGFFSAQDAEVDGREGLNYLWTPEQVRRALAPADADLAVRLYGLDGGPNFQDPHHPEDPPAHVLRLADRPERLASGLNMAPETLVGAMDRINAELLGARDQRPRPRLDDKVLTAWNGLMIAALARAGEALEEPMYLEAAGRAVRFVTAHLRTPDGRLLRSWRAGAQGPPGVLEDYAFFLSGLLELHRAGRDPEVLALAEILAGIGAADFRDPRSGVYYDTRAGQADLFVRTASTTDGAVPGASSVMLHNLLDLWLATGREKYRDQAGSLLVALSASIAASPVGAINATRALCRVLTDEKLRPVAGAGAGAPAPAPPPVSSVEPMLPVEIYANTDRVRVAKDHPDSLRLVCRIADGYHIAAADPFPRGAASTSLLVPLRVTVIGGTGVAVYADYPKGERYEGSPAGGGTIMVYRGMVEFRVALEREGEWSGRPLLAVTYQACSDRECLAPQTVELDVAIDRG